MVMMLIMCHPISDEINENRKNAIIASSTTACVPFLNKASL